MIPWQWRITIFRETLGKRIGSHGMQHFLGPRVAVPGVAVPMDMEKHGEVVDYLITTLMTLFYEGWNPISKEVSRFKVSISIITGIVLPIKIAQLYQVD